MEFQVYITQFKSGWSSILRLTTTKDDCCADGDRILAVLTHPDPYAGDSVSLLYICTTTIKDTGQTCFKTTSERDKWTYIRISQRSEIVGLSKYEVEVSGVLIGSAEVDNGDLFFLENIKVYASDPFYSNANGKIRDLKIHMDVKGSYLYICLLALQHTKYTLFTSPL